MNLTQKHTGTTFDRTLAWFNVCIRSTIIIYKQVCLYINMTLISLCKTKDQFMHFPLIV